MTEKSQPQIELPSPLSYYFWGETHQRFPSRLFRLFPEGRTGHSEEDVSLPNPAGVGDDPPGALFKNTQSSNL